MSGHTPGPWSIEKCEPYTTPLLKGFAVYGKDGEDDCGVATVVGPRSPEVQEDLLADARLIAAAPDLLEALKGMIAIVDDSHGVSGYHLNGDVAEWDEFEEIEAAAEAIKKAEGTECTR